jgi:hypothetical protein
MDKPKRGRKPKALQDVVNASNASNASNDSSASVPSPNGVDNESLLDGTKARRGRKPKVVYNGFDAASDRPCSSDDEHIIMKLNVMFKDDSSSCANGCCGDDPDAFFPDAYNQSALMDGPNFSQFDYSAHIDIEPVNVAAPTDATLVDQNPQQLKIVKLLKDFEEKNKNNEWPQTTSIHCYWCCHKFENAPFGIPLKYNNGKFHVFGCFCSLECASAYNFDSKDSYDEIWERYNLINLLSKKIGMSSIVKTAPTRLSLCIFGGHLNIDDFRAYCTTSKLININFPPMMTLTQQIEEVNESDINGDFKYIPVDTDRINRYKEKINLRRTKPVNPLETTLDHTMNLRFGSTA